MSLFDKLQGLYRSDHFRLEDIHTEIVAQVLSNSPELTLDWLGGIGATKLREARIVIDPQKTFRKLDGHVCDSKPDITIWLFSNGRKELIFIESKVPARVNREQLQRYSEHLESLRRNEEFDKTSLVFITRIYEAAEAPQFIDPQFKPVFLRERWFRFYHHLKAHVSKNGDGLAKELKLFMEEHRMSLRNQFRSTDLVALENYLGAKALMKETLDAVHEEAARIMGYAHRPNDKDLEKDCRFTLCYGEWWPKNWNLTGLTILLGYWLPCDEPEGTVSVGIKLHIPPNSPGRQYAIAAFREWSLRHPGEWLDANLDDETKHGFFAKTKPLCALMDGSDHIQTIKDYFLNLLKEVEMFRETYPNLWTKKDAIGSVGEPPEGATET